MLKDWLEGLSYTLIQGDTEQEVCDVAYDSREAGPGMVFVCMSGSRADSHDFIPQALEKGVKCLVVEREVAAPPDVTVVRTDSGRRALAHLSAARFGHPAKKLTMIGVTGTKGKTTTTHMIREILKASGQKTGMIGTNGVFIGDQHYPTLNTTPESYELHKYFSQMAEAGCSCCVMEISSQAFKLHRVAGIMYDYAIFTNISPDHIGPNEHADFEEYLNCKKQIFKQSRHALVNMDDEHIGGIIRDIPQTCEWKGFGLEHPAEFQARKLHYVSEPDFIGAEFAVTGIRAEGGELLVRVGIPGRFNICNALSAAALCTWEGADEQSVRHGLERIRVDGRMEIVHASERCSVIVDYAHNAVSMDSLLRTLRDYHPKRLVCVFGCGGDRSKERRYSMGRIAGQMADLSIITADNSRSEKVEDIIADIRGSMEKTGGQYIEIPDRREAIAYSIENAQPGDMIAVIGKGHEDYQEINGVRYHFLDREVVAETVKRLGADFAGCEHH